MDATSHGVLYFPLARLDADAVDSILLIAWINICRTECNMLSGIKEIDGAAPQRVPIDSAGTSRMFVSAEIPFFLLILIYKLLFEISKLSNC